MSDPSVLPAALALTASQAFASALDILPGGTLGALVFFVAWVIISGAIVLTFNRVLHARAIKSENKVDDIVADAMRIPLYLWLLLAGLWILITRFEVAPADWVPNIRIAFAILVALTVAHTLVRIVGGLSDLYAVKRPAFRSLQGIVEFGSRLLFYSVALMIVLDYMGVTITPILGALGIGGLAVALALQETLSNFFSGVYISLDRPLREGDFVELPDHGIKGWVVDINWRSVRIRELPNNIYIVPNNKVASGVIHNFDMPESEMSLVVQVGVSYGSDLDHVERVTAEVAKEVLQRVQGGVGGFNPFVRFHTFGDSSINLSVILRVRTYVDQYLVKHEFVKALFKRYNEEGIVIPFPQRTLHLETIEGKAAGQLQAVLAPRAGDGAERESR